MLSNDAFTNLSHGISGAATIPLSATDHTLTTTNDGEAMRFVLILTGTLTANVTLIVPAESRVYVVDNRTTGAFTVTCRPVAGGGVAVDQAARTLIYCDGANVYPVASGTGGGGGSGAPTDASYLVGTAHALLSGERVVTDTPTITWDFATAGQAKAQIPSDAVSYSHIQNVASSRLLGRFTAGAGDVQEITPGPGLTLDAGTGVLSATAVGQPLDATLTALAGVTTAANTLEYFTGVDVAASTPFTPLARTLLDDTTQAQMQATLGVVPGTHVQPLDATLTALAGVTTGADVLPFFTGVETASTTPVSPLARALLDDTTQAQMQATLGVTGGGGGSSHFLGLTDTPDSYTGQGGKAVLVNAGATALEFGTVPGGGVSDFLALTDTPATYAGQAAKVVSVKADATGLEFTSPAGSTTPTDGAIVTRTATQSIPQTVLTPMSFDTETLDQGTYFDSGQPTRLTVAATGWYTISVQVTWAAHSSGFRDINVRVNGTVYAMVSRVSQQGSGATVPQAVAGVVYLTAGDYVDVGLYHSGTTAITITGAASLLRAGSPGGVTDWLSLTDTPNAYTGQAGKLVQVNAGATALEFGPAPVAGHTDEQIQDLMATTLTNSAHLQWSYNDTLGNLSCDIYGSSVGTAELTNDAVTYAKMQNVSATDRLLGRASAGAGDVEELVCSPAGRALLDDADTATQRETLGLGTMAQQAASAVAITGGTITSLVSLSIALPAPAASIDVQAQHSVAIQVRDYAIGGLAQAYAGLVEAATGKWNLYMGGTAQNYLRGWLGINVPGGVPSYPLHVVGDTYLTSALGVHTPPASDRAINMVHERASQHGLVVQPTADSGAGNAALFLNVAGGAVGSIVTNATATAYNTTSDARLKFDVHALTGALDVVRRLRPVHFLWNADGSPGRGFLAHELQQVVPEAVTGQPDAVDAQGNVLPQGTDHSKLVPWLTAAVQALLARVEALEAATTIA